MMRSPCRDVGDRKTFPLDLDHQFIQLCPRCDGALSRALCLDQAGDSPAAAKGARPQESPAAPPAARFAPKDRPPAALRGRWLSAAAALSHRAQGGGGGIAASGDAGAAQCR